MATFETQRFCPHHGEYILLGDCPIVATSEFINGQARQAGDGFGNLGTADEPRFPEPGGNAERRRVPATLAPEIGSLLQSKIDNVTRKVLAAPAGRRKPAGRLRGASANGDIPSAAALARGDQEALPARACPLCCHPLPEAIDDHDAYVVGVAGHTAASKTSTIIALMKALDAAGPSALGVRGFSATRATTDYVKTLGDDVVSSYAAVRGTDPGRHPPFEFVTTLPATQRQRERDAIVVLQDAAGEDLTNHETRVYYAPSLGWADAVLFVYNPEDAPWWPSRLPERQRQAALLDGIYDDLARRRTTDKDFRLPPLVIAVSKADLLRPPPDFGADARVDVAAAELLTKLGDASMVAATERWERVHWRFIAPRPEDGSEQKGVTELFKLLLSVLRD